jgi:hypothetical protein
MSDPDPRNYDSFIDELRIFWAKADAAQEAGSDCPNGPDEEGNWPCDPQGYFGVMECQVCGRVGVLRAGLEGPKR